MSMEQNLNAKRKLEKVEKIISEMSKIAVSLSISFSLFLLIWK
jgi:hypothetical protein